MATELRQQVRMVSSIDEMREISKSFHGSTLGFVPTMGSLHDGHMSLVKQSLKICDHTVVSIFVNPRQFGPNEDLDVYPHDLEGDIEKLELAGVDVLFHPNRETIYPRGFKTHVQVDEITQHLCGNSRPELFKGVATVVLKLFNIVHPQHVFFGEKDWQQLKVIRTMVNDLNMEILIESKPIVREKDGLAMSSRNQYLSAADRISARSLSQALKSAQASISKGEQSAENIRTEIRKKIELNNGIMVDYISICDPDNFKEQSKIGSKTLIALAVRIGSVRLIDNRFIERV